jgi:DNA invertase Pin-like site-specific DNA recombinase
MGKVYGYTRSPWAKPRTEEAAQRERIERYARENLSGLDLVGVFHDPGTSWRTPLGCRPQGFHLGLQLETGDHVVIDAFGDAFRHARDLMETARIWCLRGIKLHVLDIGLIPGTETGAAVLASLVVLAKMEAARTAERGKEMMARRRLLGKALNGSAPYGQKLVGRPGHRRLVPDLDVRRVGKLIVRWRMEDGHGWEAIYRCLLRRGERRKNGNEWSMGSILRAFDGERRLMLLEARRAQEEQLKSNVEDGEPSACCGRRSLSDSCTIPRDKKVE